MNLAIIGATGMVGEIFLDILSTVKFSIDKLTLVASPRSHNKIVYYAGKQYKLKTIEEIDFSQVDLVLASAGTVVAKKYLMDIAKKYKTWVIDNSSAFRMQKGVPLIIPEINPYDIKYDHKYIANPNCSSIGMAMALAPLIKFNIKEVISCAYQSISGGGRKFFSEFIANSKKVLNDNISESSPYYRMSSTQPSFNLSLIGNLEQNGSTSEEVKQMEESNKILHTDLKINATAIRVPVLVSHCISLTIIFDKPIDISDVKKALSSSIGIKVSDEIVSPLYVAGKNEIFISRLRQMSTNSCNLLVVFDNLRKGAALNAIQIAKLIMDRGWL